MTTNIFEQATISKLRFASPDKNNLTVEHLWDLPLTTLDKMAVESQRRLKDLSQESFISKVNPEKTQEQLSFDILHHIIKYKLELNDKAKQRAKRTEERAKLLDALGNKENEELAKMSKEEILKKLQELD